MTDIHYGRKRRGIIMELNKKVDDWLESIEDEGLREVARKNTIVTGGAIASMLLGERVNDYDIYFKTSSAAQQVAEYYVAKFNKANELKVADGVDPYTPEVRVEEGRVKIWIKSAGVAAEDSEEYNYFETMSEQDLYEFSESTLESLEDDKPRYRPVFMSENAISLSDKVQIVIRFTGDATEIHKNYDFVHATCSWDHAAQKLDLPAAALECMLSRTLHYQGSLYPVASIFRMKKFLTRGWRITAGQQLKIMWQIAELDLTDMKVIREQLTGVDMAYMYQLVDAIKEVEPDKINATYIAEIIDRIFG